jgi:hypothetical protein
MNMDFILRQWKATLEFYANPTNYYTQPDPIHKDVSRVEEDSGERARKALSLMGE